MSWGSVVYDVDCAEHLGRWSATVRGTGLPATTGHADPTALVFAAVDLMAGRAGMRPSRLRLHALDGADFGAWFPHGRSEHRTRTAEGSDWSDTWTATPDPDVPGAVLVSARSASAPVPTPRRPAPQHATDPAT